MIITGIILLILGLVWLVYRGVRGEPASENTGEIAANGQLGSSEEIPLPVFRQEDVVLADPFSEAQRTARVFVERYGSYSNASNFQNIEDVLYLATDSMRAFLERTLEQYRAGAVAGAEYSGMSTVVLSWDELTEESSENRHMFRVHTQRSKSIGSLDNVSSFYQDSKVVVLRQEAVWKVDSAYWQPVAE
ncbi:MAG: hypothetical protein G01um101418_838 [Parcubacteria group bacterium Gr01-1014_18]|nr:MAG: hypothetical protein Greene041636_782 [Parcubacteria group bacterium Greene0416_36]TSC80035.1 MAG: hypothetical protein G01um101418_838 [Parcubacteria group bacterium Gr01-1014_18]TSD06613.1 MAG: hypothetical protein Greene07142_752 [Parcubacteria group bacterium Greene0714_2]